MSYNLSCYEAVSGFTGLADCSFLMKSQAGDTMYLLGYGVIFLFFVILFIIFKLKQNFITSLIGSSFITVILATLFGALGYVSWIAVLFPILTLVAGLLFVMFVEDGQL